MPSEEPITHCDVLVIGGGAAGCRAAIEASDLGAEVILVDKGVFGHSGTSGTIPEWLVSSSAAPGDAPKNFFEDTVKGSGYLANQKLARVLAEEAMDRTMELERYGNIFSRGSEGECALKQVDGHSVPRTYGPAYLWMLSNEVKRRNIRIFEETIVTTLLTYEGGVVGATGIDKRTGEFRVFTAKATILATGGAGQLYGVATRVWQSTNPAGTTGDGYALAYMAGAELVDMEFIQFVLAILHQPQLEGSIVGTALARARAERSKATLESAPACHHFMGGIVINEKCQTGVPGLYACGEVTGGIHSSGRLESNALVDCLVFGKRAGEFAAKESLTNEKPKVDHKQVEEEQKRVYSLLEKKPADGIRAHEIMDKLSTVMWNKCGLLKDEQSIKSALEELEKIKGKLPGLYVTTKTRVFNQEWIEALETYNLVLVAEMVLRSSLLRKESRGAFRRRDYPKTDNQNYLVNLYVKLVDGQMKVYTKPVVATEIKLEVTRGKI